MVWKRFQKEVYFKLGFSLAFLDLSTWTSTVVVVVIDQSLIPAIKSAITFVFFSGCYFITLICILVWRQIHQLSIRAGWGLFIDSTKLTNQIYVHNRSDTVAIALIVQMFSQSNRTIFFLLVKLGILIACHRFVGKP